MSFVPLPPSECANMNKKYHLDCKRAEGSVASVESIESCARERYRYTDKCVHPDDRDDGHDIQIRQQLRRLEKRGHRLTREDLSVKK